MDQDVNPLAFLVPALAGTVVILGLSYGLATRQYDLQIAELALYKAERDLKTIDEARVSLKELELELFEISEAPASPGRGDPLPRGVSFDLGRSAMAPEVASWDIDIRPDGSGLPRGSGDVWTGEEVFAEHCAACHGDFGEAIGRWPVLAGGQDTLSEADPVKTVGSYWPYLSTVYDYVYRAMPFGYSQSLSHDDVYAITAYLLYLNDLVEDDFELNAENFSDFQLPNKDNFYFDDRVMTEYVAFSAVPCMTNCKSEVEITARARIIDVTPEEATAFSDTQTAAVVPAISDANQATAPVEQDVESLQLEKIFQIEADLEYGAYLSSECTACHQINTVASEIPSIVDWPTEDFITALYSYKTGVRLHPVMQMIAGRLADDEIAALAAFFAEVQN